MLKPSFRFFIIPLGAVAPWPRCPPRTSRPAPSAMLVRCCVREQVVDCSTKSAAEVCVISERRSLNQFLTTDLRVYRSNLPSTSNDPAGMPPSRVALRLGYSM